MDSMPNNSPFTYNCIIDLYARAAATLYGIISLDDFFRILNAYYGEGTLSWERIMVYFWSSKNDDPIYYTMSLRTRTAAVMLQEWKVVFTYGRDNKGHL